MADPAPHPQPQPSDDTPASLTRQWQALLQDLPGLLTDRLALLSLELQRAARALGQIVVLGVVAAILGVTAWLLLWLGAVRLLTMAGWTLEVALLVALLVHGLALALVVQRLRGLIPRLALPATRRHLLPDAEPEACADEPPTDNEPVVAR